jgi:hypothetical protein
LERPKGESHCRASFSFCSPEDAYRYWDESAERWRFSEYKPLARKIADSRANTKRVKATIEFDSEGLIGEAFRKALELAKTTDRAYQKLDRRIGPAHPPIPTIAPWWFKDATKIEFGLIQPTPGTLKAVEVE